MKKIIILCMLMFILTGCGNSCERDFKTTMTKNYSKHAKRCEMVKYTSKKNNIEIITTPSKDKKSFTAKINYNGGELMHSYTDHVFTNAQIKQYNGINFLELYGTKKINNTYLILFDDVGNIRYEILGTKSPIINGNNFTIREYSIFVDGDYKCELYDNLDRLAYTEKTYNMLDMSVVDSKKVLLKEVCK